jgi:hypothetical protein
MDTPLKTMTYHKKLMALTPKKQSLKGVGSSKEIFHKKA